MERSLQASVGGLSSSHPGDPDVISRSIAGAFERLLGLTLSPAPLTSPEREAAAALAETRYGQDAWTPGEQALTEREKATRTR
jgi:hypothetical protein